jgi:hypothetical protein
MIGKESSMRYIINERLFMRRHPEGPLAAHVRAFGQLAFEQGYSKHRVHRRVVLAAGFSQWLGARGIRAGGVVCAACAARTIALQDARNPVFAAPVPGIPAGFRISAHRPIEKPRSILLRFGSIARIVCVHCFVARTPPSRSL